MQNKFNTPVLKLLAFSSTLLATPVAFADFTWNCGSGDWNNSACWSGYSNNYSSTSPTSSDNATIGSNYNNSNVVNNNVTVDGNAYANNLTLYGGINLLMVVVWL